MSANDPDLQPVDYEAGIADVAFEHVDLASVTPTVDDVALLLQTRTISGGGGALATFTDQTRPTAAQVAAVIASALQLVLSNLPADIPAYVYPQVREAVRYQAAILVERSFFQEQVSTGNSNAPTFTVILNGLIAAIQKAVGDAQGQRRGVGSVMVRSTMTDYDEYYPLPPPRQVIEWLRKQAASDSPSTDGGGPSTTDFSDILDGGGI